MGQSHSVTQYFVKDNTAANNTIGDPTNVWRVFNYMDNKPVDISGGYASSNTTIPMAATLVFDSAGAIDNSQTNANYKTTLNIKTEPLGTTAATPVTGNFDSAGVLLTVLMQRKH